MFVANLTHGAHKFGRADIETAFSLHRFQNNGGHVVRRNIAFENPFDAFNRILHADMLRFGREKRVEHARRHGAEICLIGGHFSGQGKRHQRAAVKRAAECDHTVAPGVGAGDFHRIFNRFRAAAKKLAFHFAFNRHQFAQSFAQFDIILVRHNLKGRMREFLQLRRDCRRHFRMAVADIQYADTANEVDNFPSVG